MTTCRAGASIDTAHEWELKASRVDAARCSFTQLSARRHLNGIDVGSAGELIADDPVGLLAFLSRLGS
jgi:hypothetical protein